MKTNEKIAWILLASLFLMDQYYYLIKNDITYDYNDQNVFTLVKKYHPKLSNKDAMNGAMLIVFICALKNITENQLKLAVGAELPITDYETEFFRNELENIQLD